jgi:hypothetical protein
VLDWVWVPEAEGSALRLTLAVALRLADALVLALELPDALVVLVSDAEAAMREGKRMGQAQLR